MTAEYVDETTGEILDEAWAGTHPDDLLALLVHRRHDAKVQEDAWKKQRQALDAQILARMEAGRLVIGDLIVASKGGTYAKTDTERFAFALPRGVADVPTLCAVIEAATGFRRADLPEEAQKPYDTATEMLPKSRWIETSPVLKRASEETR